MRVFILTEGGRNIGLGHINRCFALAQAFEEKKIISTFIINGDRTVASLLKEKKYIFLNWVKKEKQLFAFIKKESIIIIDSYLASQNLYKKISKLIQPCLYLDDTQRIDYPQGIVLNYSSWISKVGRFKRRKTEYLLGLKYTLLKKDFWQLPAKPIKKEIKTVLLTFGGGDLRNMTPQVLKFLISYFPKLNKKVVIGSAFQNIKKIEQLKDNKTSLIYFAKANKMKQLMLKSDIAVCGGGQTLFELARVGIPTVAVVMNDNQLNIIKGFKKQGFVQYAGFWNEDDLLEKIRLGLKHLADLKQRKKIYRIGRRLVDGEGSKRVADILISKYQQNYG